MEQTIKTEDSVPATKADRLRLRQIIGRIPAGSLRAYIGRGPDEVSISDLLDDLEVSIESNREMAASYERDRQELHRLQQDLAAMRRVLGTA